MTIIDRYLLRLFFKVMLICLISISGLYIVIDACNNLDEFLGYGQEQGLLNVLADYYSARVPWLFDRISGLVVLVAAMFAITWLQRTNELTALMAAGVPMSRIVKPLIAAAAFVSLLAVFNREMIIPNFRPQLLRNAQDWRGDRPRPVEPVRDYRSDILFNGRNTYADERRVERPHFRLHGAWGKFGRKLIAENAYYHPPTPDRPGGYLLTAVEQPENLPEIDSVALDGKLVLLSPRDTSWLKPDECFVVSDVSFARLAGGSSWRQLASTPELLSGLRNPSLDYGLDARVTIHARFVQPFMDMTLFFLGIPVVLSRESRSIFVAAGWCLLIICGFFFVVAACQAMGNSGYLLRPAYAAWAPLILLAPLAAAAASPLWDIDPQHR